MRDYGAVSQVITTTSCDEVNTLLDGYWSLLDVYHSNGKPYFVLGFYGSEWDAEGSALCE